MKLFIYLGLIIIFCQSCNNGAPKYRITDTLYNKLSKTPDSLLTDVHFSFLQKSYKLSKDNDIILDSIIITNIGTKMLEIARIIQSCECTNLGVNNFKIMPGETNSIIYRIDGEKLSKGFNSSIITVYGNFFPFFRNIHLESYKP